MIFCIQIFFQQNFFADEPDTLWTKHFHNIGIELFYSVKETADSGLICAGMSKPFTSPLFHEDIWLIKFDRFGDTIWTRTFGIPEAVELVYDVIEMKGYNNDLLMVGNYTEVSTNQDGDVLIMRLSSEGLLRWTKKLDFASHNDNAFSVFQTFDNAFILTAYGSYFIPPKSDRNIWLVKFNSRGDVLWSKDYDLGYGLWEQPNKIIQTADSGFVIVGIISFGPVGPRDDLFIIKTDKHGNLLWKKIYGGSGFDSAEDVIQLEDNGFIIAGSYGNAGENVKLWLLRTDPNGDTLWTKKHGGDQPSWAKSVVRTFDNGFLIAGDTEKEYENGFLEAWILRVDSSGIELWSKTLGNSSSDEANSVQQTYDGGYIIAGLYTDPTPETWMDGYLIRLAPETITTVKENVNTDPKSFQLSQNYPNPFNPKTVIKFQVPSSKFIKLEVYDILGREVQTLVDAPMSAGEHEVIFNGSGLPSGVYIYTLKVNEFSQSRKMLLLK